MPLESKAGSGLERETISYLQVAKMGLWPKIENTNMQGERGRENNGWKEISLTQ
jgi:hypothetical protein